MYIYARRLWMAKLNRGEGNARAGADQTSLVTWRGNVHLCIQTHTHIYIYEGNARAGADKAGPEKENVHLCIQTHIYI